MSNYTFLLSLFVKRLISLTLLFYLLGAAGFNLAEQAIPPLDNRVIDQTGTLTKSEVVALDQTITQFEARKGSQIVVLIVPSTAPEAIEQYGIRVADKWKIGRNKVDDGVIMIIAKGDRVIRIEVGYGLEGVLTDSTTKRIIDQVITPRFQQNDFYGGIGAGLNAIIQVIDGEALSFSNQKYHVTGQDIRQSLPVIFLIALGLGHILSSLLGRLPSALLTGGLIAIISWLIFGVLAITLFSGMLAIFIVLSGVGLSRNGFGGYSTSGTGGFSGGGGRFGGGGSSGRW